MRSENATGPPPLDHAASVFTRTRPRLFGIAYRILGSSTEAEDVVQEVWLRWQATDRSVVVDPAAFLATATTRLAINVAQSARSRRERYVGEWLPEPVDTSVDPALGAERQEALELAVLLLLEKLPPAERAAYVLSEAWTGSPEGLVRAEAREAWSSMRATRPWTSASFGASPARIRPSRSASSHSAVRSTSSPAVAE